MPYTHLVLLSNQDPNAVVCEPCPHGTRGNGIGSDSCEGKVTADKLYLTQ